MDFIDKFSIMLRSNEVKKPFLFGIIGVVLDTSAGLIFELDVELDFLFLFKIFGICRSLRRGIDPNPLSDSDLPNVGVDIVVKG